MARQVLFEEVLAMLKADVNSPSTSASVQDVFNNSTCLANKIRLRASRESSLMSANRRLLLVSLYPHPTKQGSLRRHGLVPAWCFDQLRYRHIKSVVRR